jgi:glycosyltransferase involved in cell wall biosynthesis
MRPLRILHVVPYYGEVWAYGGIPRLATTLTRELARRGHQVTVCTTDARDGARRLAPPPGSPAATRARRPWPPARTPDGVLVRVFPNVSNTLAYRLQLFLPVGLGAYLGAHAASFDVAHLHACHHVPGAVAARRLRRAGIPYVVAPNGTAPRLERRRAAKWVFDVTLGRGVLAGAAVVLAVSQAERRQLTGLGVDPAAIRVLPNPVDLAEHDSPPRRGGFRARLGLGPGPLIAFLGKLTPRKRVDVLLRAAAALGRPDVSLVIAGNDLGAGPALRRLARDLGLGAAAVFTGLLEGHDRLALLADADLVVYPGQHEIFGLVPLEALLAGTPVVVADDSGCGEVIRDTGGGCLVPPGDPATLATVIRPMLEAGGAWREAAREAAARVRRLYAGDVVAAEVEQLYRDLLALGAGRAGVRRGRDAA